MTQTINNATSSVRRWMPVPSSSPSTNHPVFLLRPPYEARDLSAALPDIGAARGPGTIIGVQIHRSNVDLDSLKLLVRNLSQRIPSSPVVVLLPAVSEDRILIATRLAPHGFRAVVPQGPSMPWALREALTDPASLPRAVLEWLRLRSIRLNPNQADLLEKLLTAAPQHADLTGLLDHFGIPQSSARFRLRKRRLPSPGRWFQVARALHAALRLQAQPDASTAVIARQLGFADHSALVHLLRRSFGVGAREIRNTLGWEWLLDRWLASTGVHAQ